MFAWCLSSSSILTAGLVPSWILRNSVADIHHKLMHEKRATLARLVPPVAVMLAENPIVDKYQYPDLEYFSCSAAPL